MMAKGLQLTLIAATVLVAAAVVAGGAVPKWAPTYNMSLSTIFMPCNTTSYYDPVFAAKFGIVDFDWSNAKGDWANQKPMDCEERLVTQAEMIKKVNPDTKVWVYRNLVKALPWYTSVREKISDPAYSGWFLHFNPNNKTYHVPTCDDNYDPPKCSNLYHDQEQTPQHPKGDGSCVDPCDCGGVPCGEYLWDHRNESLRDFLINEFIGGPMGLANPAVDGFYFDDGWTNSPAKVPSWAPPTYKQCDMWKTGGATEDDYHCVEDMGLTQQDVNDIYSGWKQTAAMAEQFVVDHGGFSWPQLLQHQGDYAQNDPRPKCAALLRAACQLNSTIATSTWFYSFTRTDFHTPFPLPAIKQDLASFLVARGPYAYIGYTWIGCNQEFERPPELDIDYGVPQGMCKESSPGVFTREWTKASVEMDCNKWEGTITMK